MTVTLGRRYFALEMGEEARQEWERDLDLDPSLTQAYSSLAIEHLFRGNVAGARRVYAMPATHFGMKDRGFLHPGCFADVVVFDFEKLDDVSTLENPTAYVRGVEQVLVDGVSVVADGNHTGALPGRNLLRS